MAAVFRKDITDKQQTDVETSIFDNNAVVFEDGVRRDILKQGGAGPNVACAPGSINSNAGVVMPIGDKYATFAEPGKA